MSNVNKKPVSDAARRANKKYKSNNPDRVKQWNKTYNEKHAAELRRKRREKYLAKKALNI